LIVAVASSGFAVAVGKPPPRGLIVAVASSGFAAAVGKAAAPAV